MARGLARIERRLETMIAEAAVDRAREIFLAESHSHGCAETAFLVLKEAFGLPDSADTSAAMALNGGVAYSGGMCGALTGAALAVGLLAGTRIEDHREAKRAARDIVAGAIEVFRDRYGTVDCLALLGVPIATPEQHQAFLDSGIWRGRCMDQIALVVAELAELSSAQQWQQARG